jgi:hypothetical protein
VGLIARHGIVWVHHLAVAVPKLDLAGYRDCVADAVSRCQPIGASVEIDDLDVAGFIFSGDPYRSAMACTIQATHIGDAHVHGGDGARLYITKDNPL